MPVFHFLRAILKAIPFKFPATVVVIHYFLGAYDIDLFLSFDKRLLAIVYKVSIIH